MYVYFHIFNNFLMGQTFFSIIHLMSYSDGTTDVARTYFFGTPSQYEKVSNVYDQLNHIISIEIVYLFFNIVIKCIIGVFHASNERTHCHIICCFSKTYQR